MPYNVPLFDEAFVIDHLGDRYEIGRLGNQWFARDRHGGDVGPYSDSDQAVDWVQSIVAA